MTFTEALARQKSVIEDYHIQYCECRDTLDGLIEQLKVTSSRDLDAFAKINQEIGAASRDVRVAFADWGREIDALADIPTSEGADTCTMEEWKEAIALLPPGTRIKGAWFYDSCGGRSTLPNPKLSERQVDILTGVILIK